jgi:ABC-2 type transport system ATP-binding protein
VQILPANKPPVLELRELRKRYGRTTALDGIDLSLEGPGVYGFLGPNGAGKTTTFKLICGLLRPTSGAVFVDGDNIRTAPLRVLSKLGVQFDGPVFYPHLTGRENLRVIARWLGRDLDRRIERLLDLVELTGAADRRTGGYSFGMQRRLGLAAALLSDPGLLLLDEPTSGLDPGGIADVRKLLPRLAGEQGRCVFLSSHRIEELEQVCDRVFIIHRGRIVAAGGIDQLLVDQGIAAENPVDRRKCLEDLFFRLTGRETEEIKTAGRSDEL